MNRVIKFRCWNPAGKNMLHDLDNVYECLKQQIAFDKSQPSRGFTAPYDHKADGMVWMQYTGLKDKNGKEIYEGDQLGYKCNVVEYLNGCFCINGDRPLSWLCSNQEVVGNIYQNPELLKQEVQP